MHLHEFWHPESLSRASSIDATPPFLDSHPKNHNFSDTGLFHSIRVILWWIRHSDQIPLVTIPLVPPLCLTHCPLWHHGRFSCRSFAELSVLLGLSVLPVTWRPGELCILLLSCIVLLPCTLLRAFHCDYYSIKETHFCCEHHLLSSLTIVFLYEFHFPLWNIASYCKSHFIATSSFIGDNILLLTNTFNKHSSASAFIADLLSFLT
jgi:hypothetical protein